MTLLTTKKTRRKKERADRIAGVNHMCFSRSEPSTRGVFCSCLRASGTCERTFASFRGSGYTTWSCRCHIYPIKEKGKVTVACTGLDFDILRRRLCRDNAFTHSRQNGSRWSSGQSTPTALTSSMICNTKRSRGRSSSELDYLVRTLKEIG